MAKVSLKATGGLNKDVDLNLLPEGDYSDATNIVEINSQLSDVATNGFAIAMAIAL